VDENQGDQPLSSEELLRRAREGLGSGDASPEPPADFSVESYPPPVASPDPSPDPEAVIPPETPAASSSEPDPPVFDTPPASDPSTWAPPPATAAEPADWQTGTPGPAPVPVKGGGSGGIFSKLWIVVVLIVGGIALFSFFDSSKTVDKISVGDCLNTPEEDVFYEFDPIDCTEEHDLEVFALVDLSTLSSEFSIAAAYPGDGPVLDAAFNECWERFESYVGMEYEDSVLFIDAFTPTLEGWTEVDDRIANCLVYEVNADQTGIRKSTSSLRNAQR
jgi:hypothetical protein